MPNNGKRSEGPTPDCKLKQVIDPAVAKALAHPYRSHILVTLGDRIASPNEIARELGIAPRDLNYHIKVLVEVEMIRLVRTEKRRGATEHFYELEKPLIYFDNDAWQRMPEQIRSRFNASLLQIAFDEAAEAMKAGTFNARQSHQSRVSMLLDERGWVEVTEVMAYALEQLEAIGRKCAEGLGRSGSEGIPTEVFMMGFETAGGMKRRVGAIAADDSA